jgi:hypothetical protein
MPVNSVFAGVFIFDTRSKNMVTNTINVCYHTITKVELFVVPDYISSNLNVDIFN